MRSSSKLMPIVAGGLLLLVYIFLAGIALLGDSSVADEHPHLLSGFLFWSSGQFAGGLDNPPLGQLLIAAPLHFLGTAYQFPSDQSLWLARLPVLFLLLALVLLMAVWIGRVGGKGAALSLLLCFCLEPNLLAHGHYATLDVPLTAFWWLTLWSWREALAGVAAGASQGSRLRTAALFALALSVTVLIKFTGFFLIPVCFLGAMIGLQTYRQRLHAMTLLFGAVVCLLLLSHLVYGFESTRFGLPVHFVEATQGKWMHRGEGHFAFLAGERSRNGFPEYYLVTLLLKTPLPLLILSLLGVVLAWRRLSRLDRSVLILPALMLLVVFSWIRVNIGVRHVLPLYPALLFFAGLGLHQLSQRGRAVRALLTLLVVCWVGGILQTVPHYTGYFNIVAGGSEGGHQWLLDSNLDWGQDDKRLASFLREAASRGEHWQVNPDGKVPRLGQIAVNANALHNLLRLDDRPFAWLRTMQPQGFVGASWHLYTLEMQDYERQASLLPDDPEAQVAYAHILMQDDQSAKAKRVLEVASERLQDHPRIAHAIALEALERGDLDTASDWVRRGMRQQADDIPLQLLGSRISLRSQRLSARNPVEQARADVALGIWWAHQQQFDRALQSLESAARTLPRDLEAQQALGITLARSGDFRAALQVFEQASVAEALRPEHDACLRFFDTEARLASAAAGGPPVDEEQLLELAQVHFEYERYDRAAAALAQLLVQDPQNQSGIALLCEMQVRAKLRVVDARLKPRRVTAGDRG